MRARRASDTVQTVFHGCHTYALTGFRIAFPLLFFSTGIFVWLTPYDLCCGIPGILGTRIPGIGGNVMIQPIAVSVTVPGLGPTPTLAAGDQASAWQLAV